VKARQAEEMLEAAGGVPGLEEAIGIPADHWGGRCHEISLRVVRTGLLGPARVARGSALRVFSQHSWIVLGEGERPDPYDTASVIADPTIFHYQDREPYVLVTRNAMKTHFPHGMGSIWGPEGGPPPEPAGKRIGLNGYESLSDVAKTFLEICGYPLDYRGWAHLVHGPVQGWPAGEIVTAMCATTELAAVTPIDVIGMTTDLNPQELYW
jgi:hypothetical protein